MLSRWSLRGTLKESLHQYPERYSVLGKNTLLHLIWKNILLHFRKITNSLTRVKQPLPFRNTLSFLEMQMWTKMNKVLVDISSTCFVFSQKSLISNGLVPRVSNMIQTRRPELMQPFGLRINSSNSRTTLNKLIYTCAAHLLRTFGAEWNMWTRLLSRQRD